MVGQRHRSPLGGASELYELYVSPAVDPDDIGDASSTPELTAAASSAEQLPSSVSSGWSPPPSFDEYRLVQLIGRGGMGEVYLAHDELLDRPVAVKLISGIEPDPATRDRFLLEARAAARLQHPNVLTVYRVGELQGRPFLISEFIHGKGLDVLPKPLPWRRALELGIGLSRGLAAAHRRGVLHRDIKPGNAILTDDGEVKLLDFGLAKLLDGVPSDLRSSAPPEPPPAPPPSSRAEAPGGGSTLTSMRSEITPTHLPAPATGISGGGALMGTPDYMPPEVWRGEPATRRSDVYSLGALLFELCAGRPPHKDQPVRVLAELVQKREPPPLGDVVPSVNPRFAAVIERCLRRDPAERFASGDELREALEQLDLTSRSSSIPEGNPYRGLHAFEAEHRALFFGRRGEIGALLERVRAEPLVIVAGDSGVGKSSLCRAGVLPAVADGALGGGRAFSVVRIVPGRSPLTALAAALGPMLAMDEAAVVRRLRTHPSAIGRTIRRRLGAAAGLVLFVDQLEELVTMSEPGAAAIAGEVLGHLAMGLPGVRLLMTVRGDFLARVAALPGLGDEISRALYFLRPLTPEGVRTAIVGPARAKGVAFESEALVDTLVASTSQAEGGLPLLQFALAELWEARDAESGTISASALNAIGGVAGALARHADDVLFGMGEAQRAAARRLLAALVTPQGTQVRRREDELGAADATAHSALDGLVKGRLLVVRDADRGATYELAHEALLRGWTTLRCWIEEQADHRVVRHRLAAAAAEWERLGRAREALWSPLQLAELSAIGAAELPPQESSFVLASRRAVRRAKLLRNAALAMIPVAVILSQGAVRLHARRDLDHRVAVLVGEAEEILAAARRDDEASATLGREAFERFDALDRDRGEATWARARSRAQTADRAYGRASQALETTLMVAPQRADVQGLLGDVLYERALLAERAHHVEQRDDLLQRLELYDLDGSRRRRWVAPAALSIESSPASAVVSLQRFVEDERRARRLSDASALGSTPIAANALEPGSYVVSLAAPGRAPVRYPVVLGRAERLRLTLPLPPADRVPEGFVYVAPGRFLFGSASDEETRRAFFNTTPIHEVTTAAFLIARHETTYADWLAYLRALPPRERARRAPHVAGLTGAIDLKELPGDTWRLTLQPTRRAYTAREGEPIRYEARRLRAAQDWLRFPVSGVSLEDAQAYMGWLSSTGRVPGARLCTEREWERAARGADDREFPHGNRLEPDDANIDETYGKDTLAFGPDEVGSHPASRSPFGVDDLCGNVFEWTTSSLARGEHTQRGGAYYFDSTTVRSTNRQVAEPNIRDASLGIRVCAGIEAE